VCPRPGGAARLAGCIWYPHTMKATIDKAGRVVIPVAIRTRAGLTPGTPLKIELEGSSVRLTPVVEGPRLAKRKGGLVIRPTAPADELPDIDFATLVREERDRWP